MLDLLVVSGDKFSAAYCRLASTPRVHIRVVSSRAWPPCGAALVDLSVDRRQFLVGQHRGTLLLISASFAAIFAYSFSLRAL